MTLPVFFRRAARREFDDAAQWYEDRASGLGLQFVAEINRALDLAREQPLRFPAVHGEIRCSRVRRFPYSIFFRAEPRRLVVLAVFHARRDPGVWQERV